MNALFLSFFKDWYEHVCDRQDTRARNGFLTACW
uniref:Uncharacterized protein n=1 Tax=Arundo donax TaxID=35708 RepID=A0A0A9AKK1_ARUDO